MSDCMGVKVRFGLLTAKNELKLEWDSPMDKNHSGTISFNIYFFEFFPLCVLHLFSLFHNS